MSRRRNRQRPATPAEQAQLARFADLARTAIEATGEQRADAVQLMHRQADRIRDPDNLSHVPTREVLDAIRRLYPDARGGENPPSDQA